MSQCVKVKIRPGETVPFPNICVYCSLPGEDTLSLTKRIGRVSRSIDVPLCAACAREVSRQSGEEERLQKIGWLVASVVGLVVFLLFLILLPGGLTLWLRLLIALLSVTAATAGVVVIFDRRRRIAARPEKLAILNSTQITNFSWRATTFEFDNETFAERFTKLNEPRLMEI